MLPPPSRTSSRASPAAGGMVLWCFSFAGVAFWGVPRLYGALGVDLSTMGAAERATFTLACQAMETVVTLGLFKLVTLPHAGSLGARQLFDASPAAPFTKPNGWGTWALPGTLAAPVVVGSTAALLTAVGYEAVVAGGRGTVDGVAAMITMDWPTYLSLLAVTGVLAPVLEETVFRRAAHPLLGVAGFGTGEGGEGGGDG